MSLVLNFLGFGLVDGRVSDVVAIVLLLRLVADGCTWFLGA